jgi:hypothetical protein
MASVKDLLFGGGLQGAFDVNQAARQQYGQIGQDAAQRLAAIGRGEVQQGINQNLLNSYQTPALEQAIRTSQLAAQRRFAEQVAPGIQQQFAGLGSLGSGRSAVATGIAQRGLEENLADIESKARLSAYDKAYSAAVNAGANEFQARQSANQYLAGLGSQNVQGEVPSNLATLMGLIGPNNIRDILGGITGGIGSIIGGGAQGNQTPGAGGIGGAIGNAVGKVGAGIGGAVGGIGSAIGKGIGSITGGGATGAGVPGAGAGYDAPVGGVAYPDAGVPGAGAGYDAPVGGYDPGAIVPGAGSEYDYAPGGVSYPEADIPGAGAGYDYPVGGISVPNLPIEGLPIEAPPYTGTGSEDFGYYGTPDYAIPPVAEFAPPQVTPPGELDNFDLFGQDNWWNQPTLPTPPDSTEFWPVDSNNNWNFDIDWSLPDFNWDFDGWFDFDFGNWF